MSIDDACHPLDGFNDLAVCASPAEVVLARTEGQVGSLRAMS